MLAGEQRPHRDEERGDQRFEDEPVHSDQRQTSKCRDQNDIVGELYP